MAELEKNVITDDYALYNDDCIAVMDGLPDKSIHHSIYSPPFCGLYQYSSSDQDLSNCRSYDEFFEHYEYVVRQIHRLTLPGRLSAVHTMEVPSGNTGTDHLKDFPGDVVRLHEKCGFDYAGRHAIWKEPLAVRLRTMAKNLAHKSIVDDSCDCTVASADYLLLFRKRGQNPIPVVHPNGILEYAGATEMPQDLIQFRGWKGNQIENRYSHWIWRQYASSFWSDIRIDRVLPFKEAREDEDEKHVHPLQLDVIDRCVELYSNPGETVLTPFMGVGSEVYSAVQKGRRGIGAELKPTYFRQAVKNVATAVADRQSETQQSLFESVASD